MLSAVGRAVVGPLSVGLVLLVLLVCQATSREQVVGPRTPLAVTTFNVRLDTPRDGENRWDLRKDFVVQVIRDLSPDILGTQEPLYRQVAYLEKELPGYERFGGGRDDGKEAGEFAAIFLRRSRFAVRESGTFWLSLMPEVAGSNGWGARYPRVASWARATDKATGRELMIVNAHFDHESEEAQLQSGRMIHRWLQEKAPGLPTVFTGDLNSSPADPALKALLAPSETVKLVDAYQVVHGAGKEESSISSFRWRTRGPRIDFVLHTEHFRPVRAEIVRSSRDGRYPSDHYPVSVILKWR
jgi:endonuclease/exonuclease/phosphatase family metal-dependent hydrolase